MNWVEVVSYFVKRLVKQPELVTVSERSGPRGLELWIKVDPDDVGCLIGKRGQTIGALRGLVNAMPEGEALKVEIEEDK